MAGVGGGGETAPLIIEQTSSSEHHYELMALVQVLGGVADDIHAIRVLMEQSSVMSEALRQQVQAVLDAHAQSAQEYIRQVEEPVPVDYHPFAAMPAGTAVRDLPDGGRLFGFSDGAFLRVLPDGGLVSIGENGAAAPVAPSRAGKVTLPGGMELYLISDAIAVTHDACGIEGLPHDVEPVLAADGRYTAALPDGTRLDVLRQEKLAIIINPTGTVNIVGISRIDGVGEEVQARSISGGSKSFRAMESGHAGMIEADGTIHLSLASGLDLVIRFPEGNSGGDGGDDAPICLDCQEHE